MNLPVGEIVFGSVPSLPGGMYPYVVAGNISMDCEMLKTLASETAGKTTGLYKTVNSAGNLINPILSTFGDANEMRGIVAVGGLTIMNLGDLSNLDFCTGGYGANMLANSYVAANGTGAPKYYPHTPRVESPRVNLNFSTETKYNTDRYDGLTLYNYSQIALDDVYFVSVMLGLGQRMNTPTGTFSTDYKVVMPDNGLNVCFISGNSFGVLGSDGSVDAAIRRGISYIAAFNCIVLPPTRLNHANAANGPYQRIK